MGFLGKMIRGVCDVVTAPIKAGLQVVSGIGKGAGKLLEGDIGGAFGEIGKGILKGGGELVHGALSGISGLAGPVLTVAGGAAGFLFGGPFGAMAGASLGGMLGGAIGNVAGGLDGMVQQGLGGGGNGGACGCQQSYQQQNYNDFGGGYNCGMPGNCGGQLPYSFYQGAQGYPGGNQQWGGQCYQPSWGGQPNWGCQAPCNQYPQQYGLAPEIARFYC